MTRSPFIFLYCDGTREMLLLMGWAHARQLADALRDSVVRVTDEAGAVVWEAT
ncbi:hypothetical protein [Xanthobacter agilis]|uniref:Uncharacterized protein n=1 Tax=Xanthobacter agilis TaxID=47492 RepID=A0ABU0LFQ0_XANAG|nr:hypothetical protein [Xanthobacter agilis]MDQ0505977.1 hypothetical protein [Xanthobacter agilis]